MCDDKCITIAIKQMVYWLLKTRWGSPSVTDRSHANYTSLKKLLFCLPPTLHNHYFLIKHVISNIFWNQYVLRFRGGGYLKVSLVMCHLSPIMGHKSPVPCYLSLVTWPPLYASSPTMKLSGGFVMGLREVWWHGPTSSSRGGLRPSTKAF